LWGGIKSKNEFYVDCVRKFLKGADVVLVIE
jgi:hypothetical protein